jgi:hypothetical protein
MEKFGLKQYRGKALLFMWSYRLLNNSVKKIFARL